MNEKENFYIHLHDNLYKIDMKTRNVDILGENMTMEQFAVSEDNTLLVIQKEKDLMVSTELAYMDLEHNKEKTVACGEGERIRPIGFIGRDFIYGVAHAEEVYVDNNGQTIFPMYKVVIEDQDGNVKKEYEQPGIYVVGTSIKDNVLLLTRAVKAGMGYTATSNDQIIHSADNEKTRIKAKSITTDAKKREYQLDFGFSLPTGEKKCLRPKEVLLENVKNIVLGRKDTVLDDSYVYAKGKLDNIYTNAAEAIASADELAGVVVTGNQDYIWERIRRQTSKQISGVETISTANGYSSLEACVLSLLHYNGNGADARTMLGQGMTAYAILQQELGKDKVVNLTGATLDQVLYCIDKDYPVLAATNSGEYVVLVGYNELNTIVMDPVKGTTGYVGMNDSRAMFEGAGNVFIACIP